MKEYDEEIDKKTKLKREGWTLEKIVKHISNVLDIGINDIISRSRVRAISDARALIAYLGYEELKINGSQIAQYLKISRPSVSEAIIKGKQMCLKNPDYLIS